MAHGVDRQKVTTRPEQLYALDWAATGPLTAAGASGGQPGTFYLLSSSSAEVPWHRLGGAHLYAMDMACLRAALVDAMAQGYQILDGHASIRRGLRGFCVGIGAWGHAGRVHCRTADAWPLLGGDGPAAGRSLIVEGTADPVTRPGLYEETVRTLCRRLNAERTPFRPTAFRWLSSLRERLSEPLEPEGYEEPLSEDVARLCRAAHIGGPVVHARTRLSPFVRLDLVRAYGEMMLGPLPSGPPARVPLRRTGLDRWRPRDLMRACGIARATVRLKPGALVSLLPVVGGSHRDRGSHRDGESRREPRTELAGPEQRNPFGRPQTIYPAGFCQGTWTLAELAWIEATGKGTVETIHEVVVFEPRPVLAPVIRYLRQMESDRTCPPLAMKVLEHVLYGQCARTLTTSRLMTPGRWGHVLARDLAEDRVARRLLPGAHVGPYPVELRGREPVHRVWEVRGVLSAEDEHGGTDRPDRAAWITAQSRLEVWRLIDCLDNLLSGSRPQCGSRPGEAIGRVYVDSLDVQARPDQVASLLEGENPRIRMQCHGPEIRIYRAGAFAADLHDGTTTVAAAGLDLVEGTEKEMLQMLSSVTLVGRGAFAEGRWWPSARSVGLDPGDDPRTAPRDVVSEPPYLDAEGARSLGFA